MLVVCRLCGHDELRSVAFEQVSVNNNVVFENVEMSAIKKRLKE